MLLVCPWGHLEKIESERKKDGEINGADSAKLFTPPMAHGTLNPWSSLAIGDEGWIGPSKKLLCLH